MAIISKFRPILGMKKLDYILMTFNKLEAKGTRYYSTRKDTGLSKVEERAEVSTDVRPLGEKIKETTKTVSYTGVILLGVGVTGILFFYVFRELFSGNSANSVYSIALEKCKDDPRIENALGAPIKGYGEETTRRRRTHVSHAVYERDGTKCMRMRFYIKGSRNKAVVEVDMKQNNYGKYQFRYLLVQLDDYSGKTFILEDNRAEMDAAADISKLPILSLSQ